MDIIKSLDLSMWQWILVITAACFVGFSKTGISGFSMLTIPIMASVFGGKDSTGIILPMLLVGDVFAVFYYSKHVDWKKIRRLLPWALAGILLGAIVGNYINDKQFKMLIAFFVLFCLAILIYTEKKGEKVKVPEGTWFYILTGIVSGFASMIGNAAGPIFGIYLVAMRFKKNDYMGTAAWFFFIVNFSKLPIQILWWHNIQVKTAMLAACMIPAITVGALLGFVLIKKLNEKSFRLVIIAMTAIAAIRLLLP